VAVAAAGKNIKRNYFYAVNAQRLCGGARGGVGIII